MREILFRGKSKSINKGEWIYGSFVEDTDLNACCIRDKSLVYELVDRETVGQFTGLTDKNGKKIFEGDIIQYCGCGYRESMGTIIYDKNFGAFVSKEYERYYVRFGDISQYGTVMGVEVIGNVHDNPELLEQL